MVRSGVVAGLCLLVVVSVLSVGVAASGLSVGQTASGLSVSQTASGLSVGQTAADHPVQPSKCNIGQRARSDATDPNLTIVPHRNTVAADEWGAAVICVVNPAGRNESIDLWLEVWHNATPNEASLYLIGTDERRPSLASQHVMPIETRSDRGYERFVDSGELPPGTGIQFAVVVEEGAAVGDYQLTARLYPLEPGQPDDWATIHVVESRCRWFCGVGRGVDGVMAIFGDGVTYLQTHPAALISFLGVLVGIGGLAYKLFSSEWWQSNVYRFGNGSEPEE